MKLEVYLMIMRLKVKRKTIYIAAASIVEVASSILNSYHGLLGFKVICETQGISRKKKCVYMQMFIFQE